MRATHANAWSVGSGFDVGTNVRIGLYGRMRIGKNVKLSDGCNLVVGPGAELHLGDDVFVGRNTVIAAGVSIRIGNGTDIAEHCTIRDADHALDPAERREGKATFSPISIGARSWLGAGVRVLKGSQLGEGVVVGANAVVRGSFESHSVVAGVPARIIRKLQGGEICPESRIP